MRGVSWRMWHAAMIAEAMLKRENAELVITSLTDGKHKENSLHHCGDAMDIRTWQMKDKAAFASALREKLGAEYDVVIESDHLHIEYDPKDERH